MPGGRQQMCVCERGEDINRRRDGKYKGRRTLHTTTTRPSATHTSTTQTMIHKAALVLVLVGMALATPSDPYAAPSHQPTYKEHPMPHSFEYNVRDDYAGTDFGHSEDSDGKSVRGSYNVQLPDGRKQTVNYEATTTRGSWQMYSTKERPSTPTTMVPPSPTSPSTRTHTGPSKLTSHNHHTNLSLPTSQNPVITRPSTTQ
ncbi:uncharacterized protein [Panulirus ornatus]|uniref:uncharacterized protein n=1 Tax=Panulirus ornatus TaxID=150431 RepID=UPI003A89A686